MDELDPLHKVELAMLRAEHQKRFQTMIAYVKEKVGEGVEYRNSVARVVVSDRGAYYELNDLPEEFSGAAGSEVIHHFVSPEEATALLARGVAATAGVNRDNTRHVSILALYTRRGIVDRKNCYVYDCRPQPEASVLAPIVIGAFQPGVMPLFYKMKVDSDFAQEVFGMPRGIVFCIANAGDRHLLIRIPYDGDHVVDLAATPVSRTIH